jgi:hypothetical protein
MGVLVIVLLGIIPVPIPANLAGKMLMVSQLLAVKLLLLPIP